jgi:hypothetical protein
VIAVGLAAPGMQAHPVATASTALVGEAPPSGDIVGTWMEERVRARGLRGALRRDDELVAALLLEPSSPYSMPRVPAGSIFSGKAWRFALQRMRDTGMPFTASQARRAVAWDLGLTHALPGLSAGDEPVAFAGNPLVQAHLIKSGVSVDIFQQAGRLLGAEHYAIAAYYAAAVQALRERLAALPADRRRASGLRGGVLLRFLLADNVAALSGSDWAYLSRLLDSETSTWRAGRVTPYGHRGLPAPLRVARVAAAYRQALPYAGSPPCQANGLVNTDAAADALCLNHANDRAVHAWYRRVLATQMAQDESHQGMWPPALMPAMLPLAHALDLPDTAYDGRAIDGHAAHSEMADRAFVVDALPDALRDVDAGDIAAGRLLEHLCPASTP